MSELLDRIEQLVVHGSLVEAKAAVYELCRKRVPRQDVLRAAVLARRAWLPRVSLQLLHPCVRPDSGRRSTGAPASPEERAAYAAALVLVGAHREAMKLLYELDPDRSPDLYIYRAQAHFYRWEWSETLPFWDRLDAHPKAGELRKAWSRMFRATALTHGPGRYEESQDICAGLIKTTGPELYRPIHKSALLMMAENHGFLGRPAQAEPLYRRLEELCAEENDRRFLLLIRLWRAIGKKDREGLRSLRGEFVRDREWEELRICDYYHALLSEDRKALVHLHFGTPYPAFRKRVEEALGERKPLAKPYLRKLWDGRRLSGVTLDIGNGTNTQGDAFLKEGQLLQRLLAALNADFYVPPTLVELHEELYPKQNFNPQSSPERVHQALKRLRHWIEQARIPLEIREESETYRLFSEPGIILKASPEQDGAAEARVALLRLTEELKKKFKLDVFSSQDAASWLGLSYATAKRHLAQACAQGLLVRSGRARATRYRMSR